MIDLDTQKNINLDGPFRLEICPDNKRTKDKYLALIRKHVYHRTTININFWLSYDFNDNYYLGETVNHSLYYKDPDTEDY